MDELPNLVILFQRFGIALGIGLMIGIERERKDAFAGIRTFPLITMMGCLAALLNDFAVSWAFTVSFSILAILVVASYILTAQQREFGITTEIASLLAFLFGSLVWWEMTGLAAALAVVTVLLLATKESLMGFSQSIDTEDIAAALQFGIITLIVLPLLPDQTFGPLDVINPRDIWWMVILIAGINLIGYVLIKVLGAQQGIVLAGLLGGLASSTASALGFSRHSQEEPHLSTSLGIGVILASTLMFIRVILVVFAINPSLGQILIVPLVVICLVGFLGCGWLWRSQRHADTATSQDEFRGVEVKNPFELMVAIRFGLLFGIMIFISKAAQVYFGTAGIYVSSLLAGLTDVDAITLSLSNLSTADGSITTGIAARGIALATLSNTAVKGGIVVFTGATAMRKQILPIFISMIVVGLIVSFVFI